MSDDTQEPKKPAPEAAAGKPAAPAPAAAKKPSKPLLPALPIVPIAVIVLALAAGTAVGSLLVAPPLIKARQVAAASAGKDHGKKKSKKAAGDKKAEAGKSPVYKLDNIIVNPADSQGQRFLMCSVAIESDDPKALDTLREHEVELRDKIVTMFSQRTLERLSATGARDSLRADLLKIIRPVLGPDAEDTELHIYLPQFVVQ
jgi:flagellar FliL protein